MLRNVTISVISLLLFSYLPLVAQEGEPSVDTTGDQSAVDLLQQYVRINTINPPGNEVEAVRFFAAIFDAAGIPYETAQSAPGRGNIWARIEGGDQPGLILLHHSDVVPANEAYWTVDPLSGEIIDGYLYGRGVIDDKASGIAHLLTFLELHRRGQPLNRDVIFMATADEEAGGHFGAGWLVENRPEIFDGAGLVINEGGVGLSSDKGGLEKTVFNVEVTQKVPLWLKLTAVDVPGHGSMPRHTSSVSRLIRALSNILDQPFRPQIVPAVDTYFKALSISMEEPMKSAFSDIASASQSEEFMNNLQVNNPGLHALTRNTCSLTMLEGSSKINVVPPQASAQLDCRLVPDQDPEQFKQQLRTIINDEAIHIEQIMGFTPAVSSTDTELFRIIQRLTAEYYPGAQVTPSVVSGFTDSHFFRDMGMTAYGYHPVILPVEEITRVHGNDERLSLQNIQQGSRMLLAVVSELVYGQ